MEERVHWIVGNEEQRVERKSSWFVLLSSFIAKIVEEMKCDGIMNFRWHEFFAVELHFF